MLTLLSLSLFFFSFFFFLLFAGRQAKSEKPKSVIQRGRSDSLSKMTLRGVSGGVNLDALIAAEEQNQARNWKPMFSVGDEVEAMWSEDSVWYTAVIDSIDLDAKTYAVTFSEYGNSETGLTEDRVKESVSGRYKKAALDVAAHEEEEVKKARPMSARHDRSEVTRERRESDAGRRRLSSGSHLMAVRRGFVPAFLFQLTIRSEGCV